MYTYTRQLFKNNIKVNNFNMIFKLKLLTFLSTNYYFSNSKFKLKSNDFYLFFIINIFIKFKLKYSLNLSTLYFSKIKII